MTTKIIHNVETGEIIERDMTPEELAQWEKDQAEALLEKQHKAEKQAAKLAAQSKLEALGLTTDDLRALGL